MAERKAPSCSARSACSQRPRLSALASCAAAAAAAWCAFASSRSLCGQKAEDLSVLDRTDKGADSPCALVGFWAILSMEFWR